MQPRISTDILPISGWVLGDDYPFACRGQRSIVRHMRNSLSNPAKLTTWRL